MEAVVLPEYSTGPVLGMSWSVDSHIRRLPVVVKTDNLCKKVNDM
jgi:hypothetical protein